MWTWNRIGGGGQAPPPYGIERNAAVESPEYRLCGNGIRILRLPLVAQDDSGKMVVRLTERINVFPIREISQDPCKEENIGL